MQAVICCLHQRQQALHQEVVAVAAFSRCFFRRVGKHVGFIDPVQAVRHQEMSAAILVFDALEIGFGSLAFRQRSKLAP